LLDKSRLGCEAANGRNRQQTQEMLAVRGEGLVKAGPQFQAGPVLDSRPGEGCRMVLGVAGARKVLEVVTSRAGVEESTWRFVRGLVAAIEDSGARLRIGGRIGSNRPDMRAATLKQPQPKIALVRFQS
jgi:hypothetical protein